MPEYWDNPLLRRIVALEKQLAALQGASLLRRAVLTDSDGVVRYRSGMLDDDSYGVAIYDDAGDQLLRADEDGLVAEIGTGGLTVGGGLVRAIDVEVDYAEYTAQTVPSSGGVYGAWTAMATLSFTPPPWATSALVQATHSASIGNLTGNPAFAAARIVIAGVDGRSNGWSMPNNDTRAGAPTMGAIVTDLSSPPITVVGQSRASATGNLSGDGALSASVFWLR